MIHARRADDSQILKNALKKETFDLASRFANPGGTSFGRCHGSLAHRVVHIIVL